MFASNQEFCISGDLSQIETALRFALQMSGEIKNIDKKEQERGCMLTYQITDTGKYCIGWSFKEPQRGWQAYPFDFDIHIVAELIEQHIRKQPRPESHYDYSDGSTEKGFLMKHGRWGKNSGGIKEPFYCIASFEVFINFYAK